MTRTELLLLAAPPLLGALIGYGTNDLAIRMLFRPYKAHYLFGRHVPFTPGMIPKEQGRIAEKVASTVTTHLLTKGEISRLSRRLVSEENVGGLVDRMVALVLRELQDPEKMRVLAERLAEVAAAMVADRLPHLLQVLLESDQLDRVSELVESRLTELLHDYRVSPELAGFLAEKAMQTLVTPGNIRLAVVWALSHENIEALAARIKEKAGVFGWMVELIEPSALLVRLRETMESDPERSEQVLTGLIASLGLQARIAEYLVALRPEDLPPETIAHLRVRLVQVIKEGIEANDEQILALALEHLDLRAIFTSMLLTIDVAALPPQALAPVRTHVTGLLHGYLDREIESLTERALEAIDLRAIIVKNVNGFPPERVEAIIYELSRKELKGIIYLGGLLGFLVGCFQAALGYFLR